MKQKRTKNGAIVATDDSAYKEILARRKAAKIQQSLEQRLQQLEQRVNELEAKLNG